MTSAVPLIISLLKAAVPVTAVVADRIDPEIAKGTMLPRIVVRQSTGRATYGLTRSAGLRGLTPYKAICKAWSAEPGRFRSNPLHQMPGPNI